MFVDQNQLLDTHEGAKYLLGCVLFCQNTKARFVIMETESYHYTDEACHAFNNKKTLRNEIMFNKAGFLYVYQLYGMHLCMNVVSGKKDEGSAILIRGLLPLDHLQDVQKRRARFDEASILCNGPGKVAQGVGVAKEDNGLYLLDLNSRFQLYRKEKNTKIGKLIYSKRVGITKNTHKLWRFGLDSITINQKKMAYKPTVIW